MSSSSRLPAKPKRVRMPDYPRALGLGVAAIVVACGGQVDSGATRSGQMSGVGGTRADSGAGTGGKAPTPDTGGTGGSATTPDTGGTGGTGGDPWGGGYGGGAGAGGWYDDPAMDAALPDDAAPTQDDAAPTQDDAAPTQDDAAVD